MSNKRMKVDANSGQLGFVFFISYVGALVYFIDTANGFWEVVFAFLQAIVWPAYLVYNALASFSL